MHLIVKPRPVLVGFVAAAATGLLPILVTTAFKLNTPATGVIGASQFDDAGFRDAGLAPIVPPFFHIVARVHSKTPAHFL